MSYYVMFGNKKLRQERDIAQERIRQMTKELERERIVRSVFQLASTALFITSVNLTHQSL